MVLSCLNTAVLIWPESFYRWKLKQVTRRWHRHQRHCRGRDAVEQMWWLLSLAALRSLSWELGCRYETKTVRAKNQVLEMTFSPSASSHRIKRVPFHKNAESSSLFGLRCLIKNTDDRKGEAVGLMFCFNTLKTWTGGSPTLDGLVRTVL